jgi:hypothetical protein
VSLNWSGRGDKPHNDGKLPEFVSNLLVVCIVTLATMFISVFVIEMIGGFLNAR